MGVGDGECIHHPTTSLTSATTTRLLHYLIDTHHFTHRFSGFTSPTTSRLAMAVSGSYMVTRRRLGGEGGRV